ncbi:MAG: Coenzyme F420 hydrogenase/dehydrogenase, beta subunit C-terminal domain [Thermoplasmata archaeon]
MYVEDIRDSNLCLSCEICNAVCPTGAIRMEHTSGQFVPSIDEDKCIDCELCIDLCPGKVPDETFSSEYFENELTGDNLGTYALLTKDWDIWEISTSGGAVTRLMVELLDDGEYEGAFVLPFQNFSGEPARLNLADSKKQVKEAAKSKYVPASVFNIIRTLRGEKTPNYIIVGTPCQLMGIKRYIEERDIDDSGLLFFGLFCDRTLNFNFLKYFEEKYKHTGEELKSMDFRNKEKNGWPGDVKLYFDSSREKIVDRKERIKVKDYFQLERCLYCLDKLARKADISFGDCYIEGKDEPGRSNIIVRTEKGKRIWKDYMDLFNWDDVSIDSIIRSQSISQKRENQEFRNILKSGKGSETTRKKLSRRKKYIELGKKSEFDKIERSVSSIHSENLKLALKSGITLTGYLLKDIIFKDSRKFKSGKNVVILGGNLFNKGAQAMTFTVVDQIKRRFPGKTVYLFKSRDFERDKLEKERYDFGIRPWDVLTRIELLSDQDRIFKEEKSPYLPLLREIKEIVENTSFFIDISGYALSSEIGDDDYLPNIKEIGYLLNIMVAKKFGRPFYIFPQSIGPFEYTFWERIRLYPLMKKYLKYPKKIFAREREGFEEINEFTSKNVKKANDIVLMNEEYDLDKIFVKDVELKDFDIPEGAVGIIPNSQIMKRVDPDKIYDLYASMIEDLLEMDKIVFITRHSHEDFHICKRIKKLFSSSEYVRFISDDLNALELENIISRCDFIIGSRYHSIIHAYKNTVPALVLGWATKYRELLQDFAQVKYHVDIREEIKEEKIREKLRELSGNYKEEKNVLKNNLKRLRQEKTVFEMIWDKE